MKKLLISAVTLLVSVGAFADEGMWMLPLLQKMNAQALRDLGCKLTAEQIYSTSNPSIKDAVVQFGSGCTAERLLRVVEKRE